MLFRSPEPADGTEEEHGSAASHSRAGRDLTGLPDADGRCTVEGLLAGGGNRVLEVRDRVEAEK